MADSVIVDDRDSSFVYSPLASWTTGGVSNELDGTTHDTATPGATATITFSGTSVQVFGTIDIAGLDPNNPNDPVSTYSIDGSTNVTYTGQRSQIIIQYKVQFFQSPTLTPGEHTLVITNTVNHGRLILDYIQFASNPTTTVTTSTGLSTTTTSSSTVSQSPEVASPHSVNISTGALIGAVIGAVTVLFIMAFFIWCLRRRVIKLKRLIQVEPAIEQQVMTSSPDDGAGITPFTQAIRTDEAASLSTPFSTAGGSAIRGGTSREKFVLHNASESTSFQSNSAVDVTHRQSYPDPPLIGQSFGGLYPDPQPHTMGPASPQFRMQDTHADAPPSYHFGSPMRINREGD